MGQSAAQIEELLSRQPKIIPLPHRRKLCRVIPISFGELYIKVDETFTVRVLGHTFTIPRGFVSDGASVPWLFWRVIPKYDSYLRAAIVHDYLYRTGLVSRRLADKILWELAAEDQTPNWQCFVIWMGLKVGGESAWKKYETMRRAGTDPTMRGDLPPEYCGLAA